ncbi:hypothetical protein BC936DRAFT_142376 [Jimgerdemannia flammicorona]|uniref:Uncharacterized protein n=1 Tax=Jimgerdemannia flammicorona TaxID=994334 RepID=A0A433A0H7_9FUNG|nr:hypothetical protein BC936DRAFT_142376 [Jimgerdemannia flammicorona]
MYRYLGVRFERLSAGWVVGFKLGLEGRVVKRKVGGDPKEIVGRSPTTEQVNEHSARQRWRTRFLDRRPELERWAVGPISQLSKVCLDDDLKDENVDSGKMVFG